MKSLSRCIFVTAFLCALAGSTGQGSEFIPDSVANAIRRLQPKLSDQRAKHLADAFRQVSADPTCGIPWQILVSIAYNESSLGIQLYNARSSDYGIMQVNEKNILRYGLSQVRLMKDAAYSIRFACKLLRDNKERYGQKYAYWLGIYRSGTALWQAHIRDNAERYDRIIRRTAQQIGYYDETRLADAR